MFVNRILALITILIAALCWHVIPASAQQNGAAYTVTTCGVPPNGFGLTGTGYTAGGWYPVLQDTTGRMCGPGSGGGGATASNITQFGGNIVVTGTGVSGLGIPRVTISSDSTVGSSVADGADIAEGATSQAACGGSTFACSVDQRLADVEAQIVILQAIANSPLSAGTSLIGKVGIDQTTPGTTNAVAVPAIATGGGVSYHLISANSTNSTLISTGQHTLMAISVTTLGATAGYLRLYDTASAPTCSSATGAGHVLAAIGSSTALGGQTYPLPVSGEAYVNGLSFCITGGSADTDNTSAPAGIIVNATYK